MISKWISSFGTSRVILIFRTWQSLIFSIMVSSLLLLIIILNNYEKNSLLYNSTCFFLSHLKESFLAGGGGGKHCRSAISPHREDFLFWDTLLLKCTGSNSIPFYCLYSIIYSTRISKATTSGWPCLSRDTTWFGDFQRSWKYIMEGINSYWDQENYTVTVHIITMSSAQLCLIMLQESKPSAAGPSSHVSIYLYPQCKLFYVSM